MFQKIFLNIFSYYLDVKSKDGRFVFFFYPKKLCQELGADLEKYVIDAKVFNVENFNLNLF